MRCVQGTQVTRFQNIMLNHCIFNRPISPFLNLYLDNLAIHRPYFDGNNAVYKFDSIKRSVLLVPSTLPRLREYSSTSLFLFKNRLAKSNVQRKTEFCISSYFHQTLSDHLKFTFSTNALLIWLLYFLHTCAKMESISSFSKQRFTKILSIIS